MLDDAYLIVVVLVYKSIIPIYYYSYLFIIIRPIVIVGKIKKKDCLIRLLSILFYYLSGWISSKTQQEVWPILFFVLFCMYYELKLFF